MKAMKISVTRLPTKMCSTSTSLIFLLLQFLMIVAVIGDANINAQAGQNDDLLYNSYQHGGVKYSIVASRILRPSTVQTVMVSLSEDSFEVAEVMASLIRNGQAVTSNSATTYPGQSQGILLKASAKIK